MTSNKFLRYRGPNFSDVKDRTKRRFIFDELLREPLGKMEEKKDGLYMYTMISVSSVEHWRSTCTHTFATEIFTISLFDLPRTVVLWWDGPDLMSI